MNHRAIGAAGEDAAEAYLVERGAVVLARNYRCRAGEIDIICDIAGRLVFVEVKRRRTARYGSPASAVDARKQARIAQTALAYLKETARSGAPLRFDVIEVTPRGIRHIPAAFAPGDAGF